MFSLEGWKGNIYDDVRGIQAELIRNEIELISQADESTTGPASLMVMDPDGNLVLIDQHIKTIRIHSNRSITYGSNRTSLAEYGSESAEKYRKVSR